MSTFLLWVLFGIAVVFAPLLMVVIINNVDKLNLGISTIEANTAKKNTSNLKKNGWKVLAVFIALVLATYIIVGTTPTQLPAWRWVFYLTLSFLIVYGDDLGKWIGTSILLLAVAIGGWATFFGTESLERKAEYLRSLDSGDIDLFNQSSSSQSSPCGPGKYDEGIIESTTVPLRLERAFPCTPNLYADFGVPILVRYNGEGKWKRWDVTEDSSPPAARGTVKYVEILLVHSGQSSRVTLRYGW